MLIPGSGKLGPGRNPFAAPRARAVVVECSPSPLPCGIRALKRDEPDDDATERIVFTLEWSARTSNSWHRTRTTTLDSLLDSRAARARGATKLESRGARCCTVKRIGGRAERYALESAQRNGTRLQIQIHIL